MTPQEKPPIAPPASPAGDGSASAPDVCPAVAKLAAGRTHRLIVAALVVLTIILAVTSLLGDSPTFDEPFHMAAGLSYLKTSDFRLSPDHPPLARAWATWPLLWMDDVAWPAEDHINWVDADNGGFSIHWLFELNPERCQQLVVTSRCMLVILLAATCLAIYGLARTLFGPLAGLLALALATLSPTLLAHGRLVTTDLPITLCVTLVLWTFGLLGQRFTWWRLSAAALALTAAALTKLSWPLILPALFVMALAVILRRRPVEVITARRRGVSEDGTPPVLRRWHEKTLLLAAVGVFVALVMWAGVWVGYGGNASLIQPLPADATPEAKANFERTLNRLTFDWHVAMFDENHQPRTGFTASVLRYVFHKTLLPEAYVFGLARTLHFTGQRYAYLMGDYSDTGWRSYFPIAFAVKTPIATMLLLLAGVAAVVLRRGFHRDGALLIGVIFFGLFYGAFMVRSSVNIGHRHLLPLYPVVIVLASASAAWLGTRWGRFAIGTAVLWLVGANLWVYPHYLSYYNELIGGPSNGHKYLVDSSTDWGQDLCRLADYADAHPDEDIKLAYFGSANPTCYLKCAALPSYAGFTPTADLTPGTYVVSATQLTGVYDPEIRDSFWTPTYRQAYATLLRIASTPEAQVESGEHREQREQARLEYDALRRKRLIANLRAEQPDERIGYSLFVYRLDAGDVERLTRP